MNKDIIELIEIIEKHTKQIFELQQQIEQMAKLILELSLVKK